MFFLDGQKIAKKLEVQVRSETLKIKSLVPQYNLYQAEGSPESKDMLLQDAFDPAFLATQLQPHLLFYSKAKQELINACLTVQRSSEEIALVRDEMQRTLNYYSNMLNKVDISLTQFSTCQPSLFARGAISLLHSFRKAVAMRMRVCQDHFSPILSEECTITDVCSDEEEDDNDYEDDDAFL